MMQCFAEFSCFDGFLGQCCADADAFWAGGVWGGPSGGNVWSFDAWGVA